MLAGWHLLEDTIYSELTNCIAEDIVFLIAVLYELLNSLSHIQLASQPVFF